MNEGNKNPFYGKTHTDEVKRKIGLVRTKGKWIWGKEKDMKEMYLGGMSSIEIANKMGVSKGFVLVTLRFMEITMRRSGNKKGYIPWNKGKPYLAIKGERNTNWKGGITPLIIKIRRCFEYKNWVKEILKRDNWICLICKKRGGNMEVDHYPKKFSDIIKEYIINSFEKALSCKELWNLDNGRTLCKSCHNKTKNKIQKL